VTSVVSLLTFANSASFPIAVFEDMQQEYPAKPPLLAISEIDRALDSCRIEMAYERSSPSCYSCEAFTALVDQSRGGVVLVGFAGESACLPAMIDGFHRNHKVAYRSDASASHALDDMPADDVQPAVSRVSALYGDVYETADWIASALPRKLGHGRNAGG
jgi:nicotinamidase-related amidase